MIGVLNFMAGFQDVGKQLGNEFTNLESTSNWVKLPL